MQDVLTPTTAEMTEWIKAYKISELEKKENLTFKTIKKRTNDYIPIEFENALARVKCRRWEQNNPYSIRYIRRKDIEKRLKDK